MEDIEIIDLYWARSEAAIAESAKKYGRYCKSIANNILSSDEDSEECVNDTWMGAWKSMPDQRPSRLAVFLGKIARNIALNKLDHRKAKKRNSEFDLILSELGDCVRDPEDVESRSDEAETARAVSAFLRTVDADSRGVFLRRYWYADPVADIAKRFGMSEAKVKSMLFRLRNKLREHLMGEGIII